MRLLVRLPNDKRAHFGLMGAVLECRVTRIWFDPEWRASRRRLRANAIVSDAYKASLPLAFINPDGTVIVEVVVSQNRKSLRRFLESREMAMDIPLDGAES